jgi:hypothetical protein
MSAFVLVLAAGLAVGNGPEKVSVAAYEGLDLSGAWEGWLAFTSHRIRVELRDGDLKYQGNPAVFLYGEDCVDEGAGRLRFRLRPSRWGRETRHLGIYKQDRERITICFAPDGGDRPDSFLLQESPVHFLITLRRVKPGK